MLLRGAHHHQEPITLRGISPAQNAESAGYSLIGARRRADERIGCGPEYRWLSVADEDGMLLFADMAYPRQAPQVSEMITW